MQYSRSHRRHHLARLKAKRRFEERDRLNDPALQVLAAAKRSHTACVCSCLMCGNPRRHSGNASLGLTRQEQRSALALHEVE